MMTHDPQSIINMEDDNNSLGTLAFWELPARMQFFVDHFRGKLTYSGQIAWMKHAARADDHYSLEFINLNVLKIPLSVLAEHATLATGKWLWETRKSCSLYELYDALGAAAGRGHLCMVHWVLSLLGRHTTLDAVLRDVSRDVAINMAAANGHTHVCQALIHHFHLKPTPSMLTCAVHGGSLELCKWMNVSRDRLNLRQCLIVAAECEHYDVFEWLLQPYMGSPLSIALDVLRECVRRNCVAPCHWLMDRFRITREKLASRRFDVFREAALHGSLAVCCWLLKRFQLTPKDVNAPALLTAMLVCSDVDLETCEWVVRRFGVTVTDVRAQNMLGFTIRSGTLTSVKWLIQHFGRPDDPGRLTVHDVHANDDHALKHITTPTHKAIVAWLADEYNLQIKD